MTDKKKKLFSFKRTLFLLLIILLGPFISVTFAFFFYNTVCDLFGLVRNETFSAWGYATLILIYPLTLILIVPATRLCKGKSLIFHLLFGICAGIIIGVFFSPIFTKAYLYLGYLGLCHGVITALLVYVSRIGEDNTPETTKGLA